METKPEFNCNKMHRTNGEDHEIQAETAVDDVKLNFVLKNKHKVFSQR